MHVVICTGKKLLSSVTPNASLPFHSASQPAINSQHPLFVAHAPQHFFGMGTLLPSHNLFRSPGASHTPQLASCSFDVPLITLFTLPQTLYHATNTSAPKEDYQHPLTHHTHTPTHAAHHTHIPHPPTSHCAHTHTQFFSCYHCLAVH